MTNEQEKAKELAKLLTAFADGKTIQYEYKGKWHNCQDNMWGIHDMSVKYNTRIKPETKRIEYGFDDDLVGKIVIEKNQSSVVKRMIISQDRISVLISDYQNYTDKSWYGYKQLAELFTWSDNAPCYKEVECE